MSRLPQKTQNKTERMADVDDNVPAYHIVGQISKPKLVSEKNEDEVDSTLTTEELTDAQTNDLLCQNFKEVLKKNGTITVN